MQCVRMPSWSLSIFALAAAILALGLGAGPAGAADLLSQKVLPLSLATEAAQGALSACEQKGFHISVAVT
ncbi:MAG TPA: hypothetical protein VL523_02775, partial [Terriglobia bacterium]|nr:hypothetical protein [Terriglobia bacterium]